MDAVMIKLEETLSNEFTSILPSRGGTSWKLSSFFLQLAGLLCFVAILLAGLTSNSLKQSKLIWDLEAWKWCLIIFAIFGGAIVTKWLMDISAFILEIVAYKISNHNVKRVGQKTSHVFNGLKKSVHIFLWLVLVLITWVLLTSNPSNRHTSHIIHEMTKALVATIIGVIIWVMKTFLLELLSLSFIVERSEKKIKESIKDQEDLRTFNDIIQLENNPDEDKKKVLVPLGKKKEDGGGVEVLTAEYDSIKKVRHWTPEWMIDKIIKTELPLVVRAQENEIITVERVARRTADVIFDKIARACEAATTSEGSSKAPIKRLLVHETRRVKFSKLHCQTSLFIHNILRARKS